MEWLGYISALCFFGSFIPQLWRTYRLKSVDDISIWMWLVLLLGYFTGLMYGAYLGKAPLILSYLLGINCTGLMLVMYVLYKDPRKDKIRQAVKDLLKELRRKHG